MCSAMIGAALFAAAPLAHADEDPNANPPNCSAADLEFVRAGVQQATGQYFVDHPEVNNFFNSLDRFRQVPENGSHFFWRLEIIF